MMIELTEDGNLIKWIEHLRGKDSSGAWNKKDAEIFKQILDDYEKARVYEQIEKCVPEMYKDWKAILPQIKQNQKLRDEIVDLADIWDGAESGRYGNALQGILDKLGIKDIPAFYKKENIDKLLKELEKKK